MNRDGATSPSSLRIALVSETWFPQVNGVSRSLGKLVESLARCGDTTRLFIPRYPEGSSTVEVSTVGFRSLPLPFYPEVRLPVVTPAMVGRRLAAFRPDVVHSSLIRANGTRHETAILFYSSNDEETLRASVQRHGANGYVCKGDIAGLRRKVAEVLAA